MYEAKYDMHNVNTLEQNIEKSHKNFNKILEENSAKYCFNTNNLQRCE
jgi:hypothetical protein